MQDRRIGILSLLIAISCAEIPRAEVRADEVSFANEVRPLLLVKCGQCHGVELQKAELALHSVAAIRKGGESGPVIVPGDAATSLLFERIHNGEMPPEGKDPLTERETELVRRWIDGGAAMQDSANVLPELTQHDVIPILLLRCTACHGRQIQEAGLDLRTRDSMLLGGKSGPVFVEGKPGESLILRRVHAEEMPPRQRLTEVSVKPMEAEELAKLTRWIELGAPLAADETDLAGTTADPLVRPEDRDFWAFQPPQSAAVPEVKRAEQLRNPIDAFILHNLDAKGLTLSPEADRRTLIRRAAFDLTGLPPEPDEVKAFVADTAPDAYERLIDRLLGSPRYGERWGRHWLDVAGYADCEGRREQHLPRPFAWRYRDYVIRSFNADKPYDHFLQEQLAGDELVDYEHATEITQEIEDNLVATAFLRMAPDPTWANLTGFVPDRLEVMADVIDVVGSGVMGLTIKCARCHSHKFDPIPQRDYYRLLAVFKGAYDEHDWLKPELNSFGGALSAGFGERYLPYVSTSERTRRDSLVAEVAALNAGPQSAESHARVAQLQTQIGAEPRIMALWDRGQPSPTYVYRRGDYTSSGTVVGPGPPAVVSDVTRPFEIAPPFSGVASTGRRLAFARWLTDSGHPLTARVMANRVWMHHFGTGIVRSVGNFGHTGDRPAHPELLDWLAREFVRSGWSLKSLHRLMMTSASYRQQSLVTAERDQLDPGNSLLSRMPMRRMDAESLRDTLLLVAGQLDETRFGPADAVQVHADGLVVGSRRRSIYVQQLRKQPVSLLESFDLPAMNPNCLQRSESLVAPQALHLMNDTTVRQLSGQLADRVVREAGADPAAQINRMFAIALSRTPSTLELHACQQTLMQLTAELSSAMATDTVPPIEPPREALATVCHTILNSAMFLYVD